MDINQVLMDYDNMFGSHSLEDIEDFLTTNIEVAMDERDYTSALSLLNEMMGLCRDTKQNAKGLRYCADIEDTLVKMGMEGTVEYATGLLNVANSYRIFGYYMKAQSLFERVEVIYREKLSAGDYRFATLYNNWAFVYQSSGELRQAENMFRRALSVVDMQQNAWEEQATTRCNLAQVLLQLAGGVPAGKNGQRVDGTTASMLYEEALQCLERALRIFEWDGKRDYHYSTALAAMGDALCMREAYVQGADYYAQAMQEMEKHVGKTDAYLRIEERYKQAKYYAEAMKKRDDEEEEQTAVLTADMKPQASVEYLTNIVHMGEKHAESVPPDIAPAPSAPQDKDYVDTLSEDVVQPDAENNWLHVCKRFYEMYGAKMIHEEFPDYEARIAVGLVGEGSECFGYDDAISRDHDFALGFCLWLSEEDYRSIGAMVQKSYEQLLVDFGDDFLYKNGIEAPTDSVNKVLSHRRGVSSVREFYENLLGVKVQKTPEGGYILPDSWRQISEEKLAAATNGMVFRDDTGAFTKIRESLLEYYPTKVWMMRLAEKLHGFAQTAQTNYARMMARQDYVTASLCVTKGMQYTMEIIYLLNQKYAPYYKWMRKGMQSLSLIDSVAPILDRIAVIPNQAAAWEGRIYNAHETNYKDEIVSCFEDIAEYLLMELKMQGVVKGTDTFLDVYAQDLIKRVDRGDFGAVEDAEMEENYREYVNDLKQAAREQTTGPSKYDLEEAMGLSHEVGTEKCFDREEVIAAIIDAEWNMYGSRIYPDDWNTFFIMRKSRYMAWPDELLTSYLQDCRSGDSVTVTRGEKRIAIEEDLVQLQLDWLQKFIDHYPKIAGYVRFIYTNDAQETIETALRRDVAAYGDRTFILFGKFITDIAQAGGNLTYDIMNNMTRLYGYGGVEDAERQL